MSATTPIQFAISMYKYMGVAAFPNIRVEEEHWRKHHVRTAIARDQACALVGHFADVLPAQERRCFLASPFTRASKCVDVMGVLRL